MLRPFRTFPLGKGSLPSKAQKTARTRPNGSDNKVKKLELIPSCLAMHELLSCMVNGSLNIYVYNNSLAPLFLNLICVRT
jgi:hypothetical protein